jgi:hypothetical protein
MISLPSMQMILTALSVSSPVGRLLRDLSIGASALFPGNPANPGRPQMAARAESQWTCPAAQSMPRCVNEYARASGSLC